MGHFRGGTDETGAINALQPTSGTIDGESGHPDAFNGRSLARRAFCFLKGRKMMRRIFIFKVSSVTLAALIMVGTVCAIGQERPQVTQGTADSGHWLLGEWVGIREG